MSFGLLDRLISKARNPRIRGQRKVMRTLPQPTIRELDHRTNDGIDVRLLWDGETNGVLVAVDDERSGESLAFEVDPHQALDAFHHPYVYAPADDCDRALAA